MVIYRKQYPRYIAQKKLKIMIVINTGSSDMLENVENKVYLTKFIFNIFNKFNDSINLN